MTKLIFTALLLLAAPAMAQVEGNLGGSFYEDCGPLGGGGTTIELDNHLRILIYRNTVERDSAYRTKDQVMDGESVSMSVLKCDETMQDCKSVEGVLTTYASTDEMIEGALEYFDGTETQGDSESVQGPTVYFTAKKDKGYIKPTCR